jgi:hypothetical protein
MTWAAAFQELDPLTAMSVPSRIVFTVALRVTGSGSGTVALLATIAAQAQAGPGPWGLARYVLGLGPAI